MVSLVALLGLVLLPSSHSRHCPRASTTRKAELTRLKELLATNITGNSPLPAPPEIVRALQKYIPYAGLSYCPDDSVRHMSCNHCKHITSRFTPKFHAFVTHQKTYTHSVILVDTRQKEIIVSFRGSEDLWKVISLAFITTVPYKIDAIEGAIVDEEVLEYFESIIGNITTELTLLTQQHPDFVIVLVGHSLGEA
ncbi:hypothetical protein DSO57_1002364 [Entomophthora muscae]|uniref:Uncharacterized protein n=1 Tax=Entomophthora muscae TaxID=34485 RepID=A0ACC2RNM5_9FUNG|nr:hypothetical protein DSO57_1002364 [Entomophthora muscae]